MPVEVTVQLTGSGLWSWLEQNPGSKAYARVVSIYRKAHKQAFTEFMTGQSRLHGNPGIGRRFSESYGTQIAQRSPSYVKRVRKFYGGRYLPFTSPTPSGTAKNGHLRDLIEEEGDGFNVIARNKTEQVTTSLTMPAARVLNLRPQYRREFLALNDLNRADGDWLEKRVHAIAWPLVEKEITRANKRQIKGKPV